MVYSILVGKSRVASKKNNALKSKLEQGDPRFDLLFYVELFIMRNAAHINNSVAIKNAQVCH
jgi:hypothetical protein